MRARVAYISSLGTTAILVAAALLMLAVVGAIVAFHGWPGVANGAGVQQVPLGPDSASAPALLVRPAAATSRVVRSRATPAVAARRARISTAGLVKQSSPAVVSGLVMAPAPAGSMHPVTPRPGGGSPTAPVQPAIAPPTPPSPTDPSTVPAPSGTLPVVPLLDPAATPLPSSPQAPSSDDVAAMVGELIGTPPPPLADGLR
ncbi:MAG: hypothetical protein QOC77_1196 [Thermoleophilaceae bacterium]|jgi:hypothetical protein|nr:hypothetical protein [Thermoleophilaceae bacterium]MEA2471305.1 hypothetical protein [Thermoleophilaceae bacterium]